MSFRLTLLPLLVATAVAAPHPHPGLILEDDGRLQSSGPYAMTEDDVRNLVRQRAEAFLAGRPRKRVVIYMHGTNKSLQRGLDIAEDYWTRYAPEGVFPIAIAWRTDIATTLANIVRGLLPGGDVAADRALLDKAVRKAGGLLYWGELKANAAASLAPGGPLRLLADELAALKARHPDLELHLSATSAGTVMAAGLLEYLVGARRVPVATCQMKAGAVTLARLDQVVRPALDEGRLGRLVVWTLLDHFEDRDWAGHVYPGSILQMVSRALEAEADEPLVGLGAQVGADEQLGPSDRVRHTRCPNTDLEGSPTACRAAKHVEFDLEPVIMDSELRTILAWPGETP